MLNSLFFSAIGLYFTLSVIFTVLVNLIHLYIVYFEMFAWNTIGKKVFGQALPENVFPYTKTLAGNQGLYNGFLVAGLVWSFIIKNPEWALNVRLFFLGCVMVAGFYGAATASKKILWVQALPAALAFLFTLLLSIA